MKNHLAKDCRASDAKIRKYKESKKKQGVHDLSADGASSSNEVSGLGFLCKLSSPSLEELRKDRTSRSITFRIDSGACTTVVPKNHLAARGYKVWNDSKTGRSYNIAGEAKVKDEGRRVLQTKDSGGPHGAPRRLETRAADVSQALMSVVDMVDKGQVVIFDSARSFAYHKETGVETEFVRREGGWDLTLDLEAPDVANQVNQEYLAQLASETAKKESKISVVVHSPSQGAAPSVAVQPESAAASMSPLGPFGRR